MWDPNIVPQISRILTIQGPNIRYLLIFGNSYILQPARSTEPKLPQLALGGLRKIRGTFKGIL